MEFQIYFLNQILNHYHLLHYNLSVFIQFLNILFFILFQIKIFLFRSKSFYL